MGALFSAILRKVAESLEWIGQLWVAIFEAAWDLLRDAACWVVEEALKVAVAAVQQLDTSGITSSLGAWGSVPAEVMNILALLGVGKAVTIIGAAIGIRLVLQLIPFTRLGS